MPENAMKTTPGLDAVSGKPQFDRAAWMERHNPKAIQEVIDDVVAALKENGITTFAAVGYCFGGSLQ